MLYRAEIDGLRAVAVIPVIFFHAGFEVFRGGFVGVDIFFVISGYLITTLLSEDLQKNRFNLLHFYERRARRLLPALFVVMLACIPFAWFWMTPSQLKDFSQSLVATTLFSSNILFWLESGYFEAAVEQKPLLHTWSLAVEEQFYLVFPLVLAWLWPFGKYRVIGVLTIIAMLSLASSEWGAYATPSANFFLTPFRLWELLAGAIAAQVLLSWRLKPSDLLSFVGLSAILVAFFSFQNTTPTPGLVTLLPVLGTVCIILFAGPDTVVARLLSIKPLVGIGLISYSAYLWHQPLFAFARVGMIEAPSTLLLLLLSMLTFVLAYLTWRWIEHPIRNPNSSGYQPVFRFAVGCIACTSIIAAMGFAGHMTDGFKNRFTVILGGDVGHTVFHQVLDHRYQDCEPDEIAEAALTWDGFLRCKQSRPGEMEWILLGDSHAEHLFLGLAEARPDVNVGFYIQNGKPYLNNPQFDLIFARLADIRPATIFLTMYYAPRLQESNDLAENYSKVIEYLKSHGHEVVLVGDIPDFEVNPELCILDNGYQSFARYCSKSRAEFDVQRATYEPTLRQLAMEHAVQFIPIHAPLCNEQTCSMVGTGEVRYRDRNHLNLPGSRLIGSYLVEQLDR